jgi:hypothetical protein
MDTFRGLNDLNPLISILRMNATGKPLTDMHKYLGQTIERASGLGILPTA